MADNSDVNKRLREGVNTLKDEISKLNHELEDDDNVGQEAFDSLKNDIDSLSNVVNDIQKRVREIEIKQSKSEGLSSRKDPKLESLPDRSKLSSLLDGKVDYRTLYITGGIASFFVSVVGTLVTLFTMVLLGVVG